MKYMLHKAICTLRPRVPWPAQVDGHGCPQACCFACCRTAAAHSKTCSTSRLCTKNGNMHVACDSCRGGSMCVHTYPVQEQLLLADFQAP
jgi:hypothetical protein